MLFLTVPSVPSAPSQVLDGKPLGENLTPANMFAVLTILGCFMLLPFSLAIEGPKTVTTAWAAARAAGYSASRLWTLLGVSGFLYYIYNEVAFLALAEVRRARKTSK